MTFIFPFFSTLSLRTPSNAHRAGELSTGLLAVLAPRQILSANQPLPFPLLTAECLRVPLEEVWWRLRQKSSAHEHGKLGPSRGLWKNF